MTITPLKDFTLNLNPDVALGELIGRGGFGYVCASIAPQHFSLHLSGKRHLSLMQSDVPLTSGPILECIEAHHYSPGTLDDALALCAQYPDFRPDVPIVFLGTIWQEPIGLPRVPVLSMEDGKKRLVLLWLGHIWYGNRFAVCHDSDSSQ